MALPHTNATHVMKRPSPDYLLRRRVAVILIAALAAAAVFNWGRLYGYCEGQVELMEDLLAR